MKVVCRCCLSETSKSFSIFEPMENSMSIAEALGDLSLNVAEEKEKNWPNHFCENCLEELVVAHRFHKTWSEAQEKLSQLNTNPEADPDPSKQEIVEEESSGETEEKAFCILKILEPECGVDEAPKDQATVQYKCDAGCPMCPAKFKSDNLLFNHLKVVHKSCIRCDLCPLEFTSRKKYFIHYAQVHGFSCVICSKTYHSKWYYKQHLSTHSDKDNIKCDICHKTFSQELSLNYHMNTAHNDIRRFICETCGLRFKTKVNLNYHRKKHIGKAHLCYRCGQSFHQLGHLKSHMQSHTGERPFKCEICHNTYTTSFVLKRHKLKIHKIYA